MSRCLVLLLAALALGPGANTAEGPVLRVGMDTRLPPWSFVPGLDYSREDLAKDPSLTEDELGRVTGIDVDASLAIGERLGMRIRIVPVAWFDLEKALLDHRIDAIINAWTPRRLTSPAIAATDHYYDWGLLVAVRASDHRIQSYTDLAGMTVGHFQSQVVERTLRSLGAAKLKAYDVQEAIFADLKKGVVDAAVYDSPYVHWRVANDPTFRVVGEPLNKLGYHIGIRKADTALLARTRAAVAQFVASGERDRIRRKWEGGPK